MDGGENVAWEDAAIRRRAARVEPWTAVDMRSKREAPLRCGSRREDQVQTGKEPPGPRHQYLLGGELEEIMGPYDSSHILFNRIPYMLRYSREPGWLTSGDLSFQFKGQSPASFAVNHNHNGQKAREEVSPPAVSLLLLTSWLFQSTLNGRCLLRKGSGPFPSHFFQDF